MGNREESERNLGDLPEYGFQNDDIKCVKVVHVHSVCN